MTHHYFMVSDYLHRSGVKYWDQVHTCFDDLCLYFHVLQLSPAVITHRLSRGCSLVVALWTMIHELQWIVCMVQQSD